MARSAAKRFGMNEIRCVTVNVEANFASVEPDGSVHLRCYVVHNYLCFLDGVSGGQSLIGANLVERDKHGGFNDKIKPKLLNHWRF